MEFTFEKWPDITGSVVQNELPWASLAKGEQTGYLVKHALQTFTFGAPAQVFAPGHPQPTIRLW